MPAARLPCIRAVALARTLSKSWFGCTVFYDSLLFARTPYRPPWLALAIPSINRLGGVVILFGSDYDHFVHIHRSHHWRMDLVLLPVAPNPKNLFPRTAYSNPRPSLCNYLVGGLFYLRKHASSERSALIHDLKIQTLVFCPKPHSDVFNPCSYPCCYPPYHPHPFVLTVPPTPVCFYLPMYRSSM